MFLAGCAAISGAALPVYARTEAEAADELIAVLGVTLPCPQFAAAWLEPPTTIEYRCTPSIEGAIRLRESLPRERVGYIIDMQVARDRYASAYRFRRDTHCPSRAGAVLGRQRRTRAPERQVAWPCFAFDRL